MTAKSRAHIARSPTFLKQWREHAGFKNQNIPAQQMGLDTSSLSRLERGVSAYTQQLLEQMAPIYNCSPSELIGVDPSDNNYAFKIYQILKNAPDKVQKKSYDMINLIIDK